MSLRSAKLKGYVVVTVTSAPVTVGDNVDGGGDALVVAVSATKTSTADKTTEASWTIRCRDMLCLVVYLQGTSADI